MNGADLKAWRDHMGLRRGDAAKALGIGRTAYWLREKTPEKDLSAETALACSALALGIPPWPVTQTIAKKVTK